MNRFIIFISMLFFLTACENSTGKADKTNERLKLSPPEPDKELREQYEANQEFNHKNCIFSNPDTSLMGIKLRDDESMIAVLGGESKLYEDELFHYYSLKKTETLSLTTHPGDGRNTISIFKVQLSNKADLGYQILNQESFQTEKGIHLGLNEEQVISKLGNCYISRDSSKKYIELYYRVVQPADTRTKLLERQNMPIYFASYKFWNHKLIEFEFGFEYP